MADDVNVVDLYKNTPLYSRICVIGIPADINVVDYQGRTLLQKAKLNDRPQDVQYLLVHGAN